MSDKIFINALRIDTIIGLYPWEQKVRQTLLVDLELSTDIRQAAAEDNLHHTINYEAVCEHVIELAADNHFNLIEAFAENIASTILKHFNTTGVSVTVRKCDNMTQVNHVGVSIERP